MVLFCVYYANWTNFYDHLRRHLIHVLVRNCTAGALRESHDTDPYYRDARSPDDLDR